MIELLLNSDAYKQEFDKLRLKAAGQKSLLERSYISTGISLRWVLYNQDLVIKEIIDSLKNKAYQTPIAIEKKVRIGSKERFLYYFDWHERILQGVVARVLNEALESKLSDSLHSYRKGRGSFNTLSLMSKYLKSLDYSSDIFIIKQDIKSYGDNINHEKLLQVISSKVDMDDYFFEIFKKMIKFKYKRYSDGDLVVKELGLPTGSPLNNLVANFFLMDLDETMDTYSDRSCYFRYGDDICVASPDVGVIQELSSVLESFILGAGLNFNDKGGLFSFNKASSEQESFKYLGLMLKGNGLISLTTEKEDELKKLIENLVIKVKVMTSEVTKVKKKKVLSIIRSLRTLMTKTKLYNFLCVYLPVANDEDYWKKIDHWMAKKVLSSVYGKKDDSVFAKYPFKDMRKDGLISLRHMRRLLLGRDRDKLLKYLKL
jgi:hypothetical protein